jgi:hypothetical protein
LSEPETHTLVVGHASLKSYPQSGSAAKAALFLERFCPRNSMAPVFGDCEDGGGVVLKKDKGPTPLERMCFFATRAEPG